MGEIVPLGQKSDGPPDNLITVKPFEFRRADWENSCFIQMPKPQSAKLEGHRKEIYQKGETGIWHLPAHFPLRGGPGHTIQGMYAQRNHEGRMRDLYYLVGLVDCMINQVSPLLRTDLIRDIYKRVMGLKTQLKMNWYGPMDQVLLPMDSRFFSLARYRQTLSSASTLKDFYRIIRQGTDEMFRILSSEYTFYTPGKGG